MSHGGSQGHLQWDWALDFRNVIVTVGPSQRANSRNPRHFQRGFYDGKQLGIEALAGEMVQCRSMEDQHQVDIPAEYLLPVAPDREGQVVIVIGGEHKGQQRTTQYKSDNQWMTEPEAGDIVGAVLDENQLARIWRE
jgi:transcription elongation factor SPT5